MNIKLYVCVLKGNFCNFILYIIENKVLGDYVIILENEIWKML